MSPDNLDPRDIGPKNDGDSFRRDRADNRREQSEAPLSDREVPLDSLRMHPSLHAWLDGEVEEEFARTSAGSRKVDMWGSINQQTEVLRHRTTPVYLQKRIMDALPDSYAAARPWYQRPVQVNPATLIAGSIGALLAGAAIASMMR
jgi:hypothetical protein